MKKLILILTLIIALALCLVACEGLANNSNDGQSQNTHLNGTPYTEEPTTESLVIELEDQTTIYVKDGDTPHVIVPYDMSLVANLFLDTGERGDADSMYLDYTDGKLTINDVLYDYVDYEQNIGIKYAEAYNGYDPEISIKYTGTIVGTADEKEIMTIMMRIAQQKNCYMLKASVDNEIVEYMAAYYFDGMCYLVIFGEDEAVSKVYRIRIELADLVLVDGMELDLELFAKWDITESWDAVSLRVIDKEIYYGTELFKIRYKSNDTKINVGWCRENLIFVAAEENESIVVLDKINQESGYFEIYYVGEGEYEMEFMIYVIDDVYYLIEKVRTDYSKLKISRMYYCTDVDKGEING